MNMAEPEDKQDDPPTPITTTEATPSTSTSQIAAPSTEQDVDSFPFARDCGLSITQLMNPESAKGRVTDFKTGLVLEVYDSCNNKKDTANMMFTLAHAENPIHHSKLESVRLKIGAAVQKRKMLKKNKKATLPAFLQSSFVAPIPATRPSTSTAPPSESAQKRSSEMVEENITLKHEIQILEEELRKESKRADTLSGELKQLIVNHRHSIASHSKDMKSMKTEVKRVIKEYTRKTEELDKANAKIDKLKEQRTKKSASIKNLRKRMKRTSEKFEKESQRAHELQETVQELEKEAEDIREVLVAAKKDRKTALKGLSQVKRRAARRTRDILRISDDEIRELKNTVKMNNARIAELEQLNTVIHTFEGGRYVSELRQTITTLLTECNVSMSKVSHVIHTVCKNLVGKLPERLPSLGTLDRILSEAKFVAQNQCMQEGGDPTNLTGNTLHNDALIAQIQSHKKVLNSKGNAILFQKTSHTKPLTEEQLENNLIVESVQKAKTLQYNPAETSLVNVQKSKMALQNKLSLQRNKIIAQQQQQCIATFESNPDSLLDTRVKHKCKEEDGSVEWFAAKVTGIYSRNRDAMLTEYKVVYDEFPEEVWHFPLLEDLKNGNLVILK